MWLVLRPRFVNLSVDKVVEIGTRYPISSLRGADDHANLDEAMDIVTLLRPGFFFVANPHRYDYVHHIELREDGTVEMVDGGCQALRRQINGHYEILPRSGTEADVRFHDLLDVDPYGRSPETRPVAEFTSHVTLEEGVWAYECEVVWNVKPNEEPYVLYRARLAFDSDPLAAGTPPWPEFPPEALAIPELRELDQSHKRSFEASRRYYVAKDRVEMPFYELQKLGLPEGSVIPLT